jgi:hypothetical protein
MKSLAAMAAALLFTALTGCGGESANMSGQYPMPPGVDGPEQTVAASEAPNAVGPAQLQAPPAPEGQVQAEAATYATPQPGDIQVGADGTEYTDTDPAALADFKPALDPYGTWVEDPNYGTVWTPSPTVVGNDFSPYVTAGHWAYDDDYVWVSDYDWGWAPFHYGRWVYMSNRWGWIPGRTYAGAWVTWRYGYDDWGYVGWAPMPPTWYWRGGYAVGIGYVPVAPYVFCHSSHVFAGSGLHGHIVAGPQVAVVASHTRPYVPANPSVGHTAAHPSVGGPPPRSFGVTNPPSSGQNSGLAHAQQFARPSSAVALGGRPPQQQVAQHLPTPANNGQRFGNVPSATSAPSARFNGGSTTTLGQHAPVASAPQYRGVSPTPHPVPYSSPASHASIPQHFGGASSGYSAPHYSAPSSGYSAPHYSAPSSGYSGGSSGFHSSAPSYHAPQPSYHTSAPTTHSSGGGGGGFRGGASRGGGGRR